LKNHNVTLGAAGLLATLLTVPSLSARGQTPKPLYDRLGGVYAIATVVDDFIERLLVNATLNANPAINEARARVPKAGLKYHVTAMVCQVTGGPCNYAGRTMKAAHAKLNITEAEWDAMVADFKATLDQFAVPAAEQQELIAIVATTKADIVVASPTR
jgi:hemoglobin